jgi:hypothetical protein
MAQFKCKCSTCAATISRCQFFVRLTSPGLCTVKRFCSLTCVRAWVLSPRV